MTDTISALFDDYPSASRAVTELENAGLPNDDISIVSNNAEGWYNPDRTGRPTAYRADRLDRGDTLDRDGRIDRDHDGVDDRAEGAGTGAGIGAVAGGIAGALAGLGLLAIPGLGPVVAAGWLASTAAVALMGGAAGGIIGALTQWGVGEEEAHTYAEGVRRGGTLVTAHVPEADRGRYLAILNRGAVRINERAEDYRRGGWTRYDPNAPTYTPEQISEERRRYGSRVR
jgi:hypothetical protein